MNFGTHKGYAKHPKARINKGDREMAKRGRKTKLTPQLQEKICGYIKEGNYAKTAAELCGVGETTYYRWLQTGRESKSGKCREFWEAIKKAESFAEAYHVQQILKASKEGTWTASAWWLERKLPQKWARTDKIEHKGEMDVKNTHEGPVNVFARVNKLKKFVENGNDSNDDRELQSEKPDNS